MDECGEMLIIIIIKQQDRKHGDGLKCKKRHITVQGKNNNRFTSQVVYDSNQLPRLGNFKARKDG